jgi:TP901 family phage tail tape measure protein
MDNDLTIQLRVLAAGLDKVDQATKSVNNLDTAVNKASSGGFSKFSKTLESTGSRINVLGQRIMFMAGLPMLALANSAINTAVEIESSFVRLEKVFNGTAEEFEGLKKAAFELSTGFGKPVEEMTEVMTEFNKAGVNGVDNLKNLGKLTAETAILFDTDMTKAMTGVKSVMMGYNLTVGETERALDALNIIADKTTASEQGILDVFNRAAGTARQAGFSFRELAASQGVFEKNSIPAGRAGNAMKSILVSLTKQSNLAKDQFRDLGVNMSGTAWRTADAGDKLEILAKKLLEVKQSGDKMKMADLNEAMASLVGKFQINNLNVLLEDMAAEFDNNAETISVFNEGLRVSSDELENAKWKLKQMEIVMKSSPMTLDQLSEKYRMQQYILGKELIPAKVKLMEILIRIFEWFNKLSPETQKWIGIIAAGVIVLGPLLAALGLVVSSLGFFLQAVTATFGVFTTLVGWLSKVTFMMATGGMLGALTALGAAFVVFTVVKAVQEFGKLQDQLKANKEWLDNNARSLDELQKKIGTLRTDGANQQLQNAIDKSKEADKVLADLTTRYEGLGGAVNAVKDQFKDWGDVAVGAINKVIDKIDDSDFGKFMNKKFFSEGGIATNYKAKGGTVYAANGFVPRGTDTVPAMLTPGEMVLTKGQQGQLFRMLQGRSGAGANDGGTTVEINVGTMIASRGEQRQFARLIQELMDENSRRFVTQ